MLFNAGKCKIMHIGSSNKVYDYSLDGSVLKEVAVEKDLGVMISKDLKVSHQCLLRIVKLTRYWESLTE